MTSIDAWVSDWEIGCCRSVPLAGEQWAALLVYDGNLTESASATEQLERIPSGAIRLAGPVAQRISGRGQSVAILRCGPINVFVHDPPEGEALEGEGRLYEDNHFDYIDEEGLDRWKVTGTVRRLWVVPRNDGKYRDWPDGTGGLLQGDPKEVPNIDPRWVGPHHWEARIEVEIDHE